MTDGRISSIEAGFSRRRSPGPPPDGDPVLVAAIRAEIEAAGPITFARFMELALYDPDHGYYRAAEARPGREGDFLTAPETHPAFGAVIARALVEMWEALGRPERFDLREFGAGGGALALAILAGLRTASPDLLAALRYSAVEIGDARRAELAATVAAAGFAHVLAPDAEAPDTPITGCVLANEFLDALPVHRVVLRGGRLEELFVGWQSDPLPAGGATGPAEGAPAPDSDAERHPASSAVAFPAPGAGGRFVDVPGPPSTPALAARLASEDVVLVDGQRAEVCLALEPWVSTVRSTLTRGFVLVVDYGHPAADLHGPGRREGTLRTYVRHAVGADPYLRVGRQDLTAHVDLTALERAFVTNGFDVLGVTSQAEFLVGSGLGEILAAAQADPSTTLPAWLGLRAAVTRLLDPAATGGFRAVVAGLGLPAGTTLRGLSFRLRR